MGSLTDGSTGPATTEASLEIGIQAASSSLTTASGGATSGAGEDVEELEASDWSVLVEDTSDWLVVVTPEIVKIVLRSIGKYSLTSLYTRIVINRQSPTFSIAN